jgi:predicted DsbA family dithiol-disulfide isomerase
LPKVRRLPAIQLKADRQEQNRSKIQYPCVQIHQQITRFNETEGIRLDERHICAYNPPATPAIKAAKTKEMILYLVVLIPIASAAIHYREWLCKPFQF